jgi:Spy/CpxP family protein refolding chaperone
MRLARTLLAGICLVAPAFAQDGSSPSTISILPYPPPQQAYAAVKQHLTLSDAQIATLRQVQESRQKAEQAVYEQMRTKQVELDRLLQAGSNDSVAIGRLMVDINNLRRQLPLSTGPYKTQALAVLNDEQKQKLPALQEAIKLQQTAWEATSLNLIDPPQTNARILPYPAAEPSVTVISEP